ncbi:IniB N-terminal domain-containing protein [Micromonospora sp. C28SCA-DRY-2]|uniref:IniB N-terminal domain-containing protein n=1 Tax=Micromonospora sp. C28SCA-DRY-2 TaxID=3059522 RepID=UPI0026753CED|nr:IniB N-terminal domain-containing protein [Micromonospora sp. C28SCA-DRY-2]MDO3702752.1 IniB N-terminal domain-containing protein [Micromonospora sp. C28SCA-DRY-2]
METQQSVRVDSQQSVAVDGHASVQDFVLNLLADPDARSAFDLDPEGALRAAGLHDITAADVQDVVPLVVDYAPVHGLTPSVLGAIAVDPTAVGIGATVLPGIGLGIGPGGLSTDLTGAHDLAHTLDADVIGAVDTTADPAVADLTTTLGNPTAPLDGGDTGLLGTGLLGGDGLLGGTLGNTQGQVDGLVDGLGVDDTLGGLGIGTGQGGVVPPIDVPSTVDGVTGQVDGVLSGTVGVSTGVGLHGEASASTGGVLDVTDGLI